MNTIEFFFRVELSTEDENEVQIDTWYYGIDINPPGAVSYSEWVQESFGEEHDWWKRFKLDPTKCWQIVGKARLTGEFDYWGEYNESLDILESEHAEVFPSEDVKDNGAEELPCFPAGEEIDLTGGVESSEYVRRMRNAE